MKYTVATAAFSLPNEPAEFGKIGRLDNLLF
jgi:hypothetical protein